MKLEKMDDFFAARVEGYDEHMINDIAGCKDAYIKMAELLPDNVSELLDLGCGTGLELNEIFKINKNIHVTGIDLTKAMLDKLKEKYSDKNLTLVNASYFDYDFGINKFDCAISSQTMHHFSHEEKIKLYSKICAALKDDGQYIEFDYMAESQEQEDFCYNENKRIRKELKIPDGEFYHYDTPCTVENQTKMFLKAGFKDAEVKFRHGGSTIMVAKK